ncbi:MAG: sugar ABC transporter permease [Rhodothermaceae bacterium]|nr:sugar ABC transporter permease [Rhodothermaceae bacterium]MBC11629.1 sugar ABC transporter permease [Rhodothermaceae bacterium]
MEGRAFSRIPLPSCISHPSPMLNAPTDAMAVEASTLATPSTPPPRRSEAWSRRWFLAALLGPTGLVVLAVVAFPFVYNVAISFSNMNIYTLRDWELIGLDQYVAVFAEPAFWGVFLKTIIWTLVNVVFHVGLGVFLAVILHQSFIKGKSAWRVLLILPWAVPQYITALTWRGMFNYEFGAVNLLVESFGGGAVSWLSDPLTAFIAAILTNIWLGFPFMMVIALGGLQSIPGELYEAAEVDGASAWRQFWSITAPLLKPVMLPAITLGTIWTFNNINVVWLVSNGGEPNDQTHILVSYVYEAAFSMYRFGWAAALSMVIFAVLFVFTQVFLNRTQATESMY